MAMDSMKAAWARGRLMNRLNTLAKNTTLKQMCNRLICPIREIPDKNNGRNAISFVNLKFIVISHAPPLLFTKILEQLFKRVYFQEKKTKNFALYIRLFL